MLPSPGDEILLEPCQQFGITVSFTPAQPNVYTSSLIIKESMKTYKVHLCIVLECFKILLLSYFVRYLYVDLHPKMESVMKQIRSPWKHVMQ